MSYPQINTYPLTLGTAGNYAESLKTTSPAFTPRQSVFFMPKLLIPLKLPFLVVRELLILILKYCYGCRIDVPDGLNKVGNELFRRR